MARRTKYHTHIEPYLEEIPKLIRQGRKEEDISKIYGVAYSTLREYKKKFPALLAALKEGRLTLLEDLEDTMYTKALKGSVKTRLPFSYIRGKKTYYGNGYDELLPPDNTCLIASLKFLSPKWRDALNNNVEIKVKSDDLVTIINDMPVGDNDEEN